MRPILFVRLGSNLEMSLTAEAFFSLSAAFFSLSPFERSTCRLSLKVDGARGSGTFFGVPFETSALLVIRLSPQPPPRTDLFFNFALNVRVSAHLTPSSLLGTSSVN